MTDGMGERRPPRLAEWLLGRIVGSDEEGRSILGDAREEWETRGPSGSPWAAALWYWGYVLRFAVTYRQSRTARREAGLAGEAGSAGTVMSPRHDDLRPGGGLGSLRWNLKVSVRTLLRRPGMSAAVVATLAVGIGATTLVYTLVDQILLRPLPYPESQELVEISRVDPEWFGGPPDARQASRVFATPPATYFDWEQQARSFNGLGAFATAPAIFTGDGEPERRWGVGATSGMFAALAVPPHLGRTLLPEDDAMGSPSVVVLSHSLWTRRYGADPTVVGRDIHLDGSPYTVIGVMPAGFGFPGESTPFWINFDDGVRGYGGRSGGFLHAVARLKPGVTLAQARRDMTDVADAIAGVEPVEEKFLTVVFTLQESTVAGVRSVLLLLLGATLVVLLVGAANVANLLLARMTERRRELAVHAALGAGRGRLAGLMMGESVALSVVGGLAGFALARVGLQPLLTALPMNLPGAPRIQMDGRILLITLVASVVVGIVLGALPALRSGRLPLSAVLRDSGHGSAGGRSTSHTHGLLVVSEVALAVTLLSASVLFVQSFFISTSRSWGFESEDVVTMRVSLPDSRQGSDEEVQVFYTDLLSRLNAIPGVVTAALAHQMPYSGGYSAPPALVEVADGVQEAAIHTSVVTPSYFEAMGIPVVAGRGLLPTDVAGSTPVIVVSEMLADRYWPGENPIGRRLRMPGMEDMEGEDGTEWREVVGVAGGVRYTYAGSAVVEYYRPFAQAASASQAVVLLMSPGAAGVPAAAVRVVHDLEPQIPVTVSALKDLAQRDRGLRWAKVSSVGLLGLAGVATLLAILGVYSVLAYGVVRRTREIGIRVSLGGSRSSILGTVLWGGMRMTGIGVLVGVGLSLGTASLVRGALVGVSPTGPGALMVVVAIMVATSVLASALPAWRAVRVDPLVALREE